MRATRSRSSLRWDYALIVCAAGTLASCGDRYESCEATRSCPTTTVDAGPEGESGSSPGGMAGTAGDAGSSGQAGTSGTGGTAGADAGLDSADAPAPDTTAPTVISVSPATGTTGVRKDTSISIVFSEPMNREKTQAAYSSPDLPSSGVAFSWTTDDTVLTIDPTIDLTYAADTVPTSASAKKYAFTIATTATDRAGNGLQAEHASSFTTSREAAQALRAEVWQLYGINGGGQSADPCREGFVFVGDYGSTQDEIFNATVLQFDLSVLAPSIQSFTEATLRTRQEGATGSPFGTNQLGDLVAEHTNFDPIVPASIIAAPLRTLGVFSNSPLAGPRSLDVLPAVTEDHQNRLMRSYRSQYRLAFTRRSNGDPTPDSAAFSCNQETRPELALKYLVP